MIRIIKSCTECPFCSYQEKQGFCSVSVIDFRPIPVDEMKARPSWCPLRGEQIVVRQPFSCDEATTPEEQAVCSPQDLGGQTSE